MNTLLAINLLSVEYRPRRLLSFTRHIQTRRKRNCLRRSGEDKSEGLLVPPSKWEQVRTFSKDLLLCMTLTYCGDPQTFNREQVELFDKAILISRLSFAVTLRRKLLTPIPINFLRANRTEYGQT